MFPLFVSLGSQVICDTFHFAKQKKLPSVQSNNKASSNLKMIHFNRCSRGISYHFPCYNYKFE